MTDATREKVARTAATREEVAMSSAKLPVGSRVERAVGAAGLKTEEAIFVSYLLGLHPRQGKQEPQIVWLLLPQCTALLHCSKDCAVQCSTVQYSIVHSFL